jgi:hypothetical protein
MQTGSFFMAQTKDRHCGTNWPTEVVELATLWEFYENDGFFTTSCDPYMGLTFRLF